MVEIVNQVFRTGFIITADLNAVKNKDNDEAAELMRDHIKTAISDVTKNSPWKYRIYRCFNCIRIWLPLLRVQAGYLHG